MSQVDLEFANFLSQLPKCMNYRYLPHRWQQARGSERFLVPNLVIHAVVYKDGSGMESKTKEIIPSVESV